MNRGNVLVGQSGGPTAVINASLAGVVDGVQTSLESGLSASPFGKILGMRFAIEGFLDGRTVDLTALESDHLRALSRSPSSALGSCRYKLQDIDLPRVLEQIERNDIRFLFYIGGNDTMDTIHRIESYARAQGYELVGIGIPKTVDNDLFGTHHTPGYPSAARYVALSVQQGGRLARDMQRVDQFSIYQTVGREAGWLAAASALAKNSESDPPHIIYLPESRLTPDRVVADVESAYRRHGYAYIVVGEGVLWEDGTPVSGTEAIDRFENREFGAMGGGGAAITLHRLISQRLGFRGEFQIPESLAMAAVDRVVGRDRIEAYGVGKEAVARAIAGESGVMITLTGGDPGENGADRNAYGTAPLEEVAVHAKPMPKEMVIEAGVDDSFIRYARELVGEIPPYEDVATDW